MTLQQGLEAGYEKSNTMILMKEERIPELSLVIKDQTRLIFVDKNKVKNGRLEVPKANQHYLLLGFSGGAKDILKAFELSEY